MVTALKQSRRFRSSTLLLAALLAIASGCTTPGIPAHRLSPALLARPRTTVEPINFITLRQDPPPVYQLGPRDVLGIYIEGVLGKSDEPPPTHFPENGTTPPAIGFPMPIREDGTISLPLVPPIRASGLTLAQLEREVRKAYTIDRQILQAGQDRIIVTLIKKRTYQVLVVREDEGAGQAVELNQSTGQTGRLSLGPTKRGSADAVDLDAYENDVLHALSETGGMPGLDAKAEVTILRGAFNDAQGRMLAYNQFSQVGPGYGLDPNDPNVIRIPLRLAPGQPPPVIREEDIILTTGDIVFIESREREVFYTGGLLPGGEHLLPRDYDLDVIQAISVAGGASTGSAGSFSGRQAGGFGGGQGGGFNPHGACPPTDVLVVRELEGGGTVTILVDLKTAVFDSSQRILIQPGDLVLLQYKPCEIFTNSLLNMLNFNIFLNQLGNN